MDLPYGPRLRFDVALVSMGCAAEECARVMQPGDEVLMRDIEGTAIAEPLCPVHGKEAREDAKLKVRLLLHRETQKVAERLERKFHTDSDAPSSH